MMLTSGGAMAPHTMHASLGPHDIALVAAADGVDLGLGFWWDWNGGFRAFEILNLGGIFSVPPGLAIY